MPTRKSRTTKTRTTTRRASKKTTHRPTRGKAPVRAAADWAMSNRWLKEWSGWATSFTPHELITTAQAYGTRWEKDLTRLATYVTKQVKKSEWVGKAREVTQTGVSDVMSFLNIPTKDDMDRIQRKLHALEQRMNTAMFRRPPKR